VNIVQGGGALPAVTLLIAHPGLQPRAIIKGAALFFLLQAPGRGQGRP